MLYRISRDICLFLIQIVFRLKIEGKENIPNASGFIMVANHRTFLDPIIIVKALRQQVHYMAKAELFSKGITNWFFRGVGAFPVERGKGDTGAIAWAENLLHEGRVLGMFPEGTRSKDGVPLRPKSGAAMIAMQTGADVLPCAVCFEGALKFRSTITVRYGKPIPNAALGFTAGAPSPHEIKAASRQLMDEIIKLMGESR